MWIAKIVPPFLKALDKQSRSIPSYPISSDLMSSAYIERFGDRLDTPTRPILVLNHLSRYYQFYSDILLPLYPIIANPEAFESQLQYFLSNRDEVLANTTSNSHDNSAYDASWFALLYAVLASGAQCLSTVDREAELNSKVFSKSNSFSD